ncbi:MAG: cupin domain-containing protein [Bryobacteraceae bacterium]
MIAKIVYVAAVALGSVVLMAQVQSSTPNTKANPNFTGTVTPVEDKYKVATAHYRFDPGARTKWHTHSGGQIMLVEEGVTHHQNKGGPVMELHANESYYVQPGVMHWHGATPKESTVQFNTTRGDLTWGEVVSEADFGAKAKR